MSSTGRHPLRRGLLSAVAGSLACLVVAAPVFAYSSRRTQVVVVTTDGPPAFGSSTATCPVGQHVLFGGFDVTPPTQDRKQDRIPLATGMHRSASNSWTVDALNVGIYAGEGRLGSSPPAITSSMVYCGFGPIPSTATRTVDLGVRTADGESRSATAQCPAGTVVVGGGFATPPNSIIAVTGLERVAADLWRVSAYLPAPFFVHNVVSLTAVAYCGPGPAPKLVSRTSNAVHGGTARATCPNGTQLVFGGGTVPAGHSELSGVFLNTLRAETQSRWSAGGVAGFTGKHGRKRGKVTALAYCR